MFKTKLQELCHQKSWALPRYSCMKDGEDHNPQFKASVVVNGINFDTPGICKSLKESQNVVARLAFLHFTSDNQATCAGSKAEQIQKASNITSNPSGFEAVVENKATCGESKTQQAQVVSDLNSTASSVEDGKSCCKDDYSPSSWKDETLELAPVVDSLTFHDQPSDPKPGSPSISTSCTKFVPQTEGSKDEDDEIAWIGNISRLAMTSNEEVIASPVLSGTDSSAKTRADSKTYLLCNRIRVYTFTPSITFTKGNVVLPIAEGKWAVVNLEFPMEKDA